jgi:hypothetical protein
MGLQQINDQTGMLKIDTNSPTIADIKDRVQKGELNGGISNSQ